MTLRRTRSRGHREAAAPWRPRAILQHPTPKAAFAASPQDHSRSSLRRVGRGPGNRPAIRPGRPATAGLAVGEDVDLTARAGDAHEPGHRGRSAAGRERPGSPARRPVLTSTARPLASRQLARDRPVTSRLAARGSNPGSVPFRPWGFCGEGFLWGGVSVGPQKPLTSLADQTQGIQVLQLLHARDHSSSNPA
jgi:hypothetical protein